MEDVGRGRVGVVDFVMNRAHGGDRGFDGSYAEVDGVMSRDSPAGNSGSEDCSATTLGRPSAVACSALMRSAMLSEPVRAMSTTSSRLRCRSRKLGPTMFQWACLATNLKSNEVDEESDLHILGQSWGRSEKTVLRVVRAGGLRPGWLGYLD